MKPVLGRLVERVRKNMLQRSAGVTVDYARETVSDVLDALTQESWEARDEAEICQSGWEELIDGG